MYRRLTRFFGRVRDAGIAGALQYVVSRLRRNWAAGHDANSVSHREALAWFGDRRADYDKQVQAISRYVEAEGLVLDIGANIGYFTARLAQLTGFSGQVHLFEPAAHLAKLCAMTVAGARYRAHVHACALGEADGAASLYTAADGNIGWNTIVVEAATVQMARMTVRVRAFDELGIDGVPCLIKIDVEGAEYLVLRGMRRSLARWEPLPALLCEIGWGSRHPHWPDVLAEIAHLRSLGYVPHDLEMTPVDEFSLTGTTDLLFLAPHHLLRARTE